MSAQKSTVPIHTKNNVKEGEHAHDRKVSLNLDPFAAPDVYYGSSHNPRKVAKSRTYSAVSPPYSPYTPHTPQTPHIPHMPQTPHTPNRPQRHRKCWSLPPTTDEHETDDFRNRRSTPTAIH